MNLNLNRQIIDGTKVYAFVEGMGFSGWVPSPIQPKAIKPYLDWTGGKITMDVWQTVLAFFKKYPDNEVQVRLYYNPETKVWRPWAFPQQYPSGMTTKELPDHPHTAEDAAQFCEPWVRLGSVHHHCSSGAFQSSTDHTDEATVPGLHITMGKLKEAKWDIHSRVCIRLPGRTEGDTLLYGPTQAFYEASLPQWFDLPDQWKTILPAAVQSEVMKHVLCMPPDACPYPERWDLNLIRPNYGTAGNGGGMGYGVNGNHHGTYHPLGSYRGSENTSRQTHTTSAAEWESMTTKKMELIAGLIDVWNDASGKYKCQVIRTNDWAKCGFASQVALEGILRSCGLMQMSTSIWAFAQDKSIVEAAFLDAEHERQQAELAYGGDMGQMGYGD